MLVPIFLDNSEHPTESQLTEFLGDTFAFFAELRTCTENQIQEWKFYNKKSGWIFKAKTKRKAIFYISPLKDKFHLGMALNENEKELLMTSTMDDMLKKMLSEARKYQEGYAFRMYVQNEEDHKNIIQVLKILQKI